MATEQRMDSEMDAYRTAITGLHLEDIQFGPKQDFLLCDTSLGKPRPIVPTSWRCTVFHTIHNLSHPSIRATRRLVAARFIWHRTSWKIREWTRTCMAYQLSKVRRHVRAPLDTCKVPRRCLDHIHVDLVGSLPLSQVFPTFSP